MQIQKAVQGPLHSLADMHTRSLEQTVVRYALGWQNSQWTNSQTDRQTSGDPGGKQTSPLGAMDRQTDREQTQTYGKQDRRACRHVDRQTDRQTHLAETIVSVRGR